MIDARTRWNARHAQAGGHRLPSRFLRSLADRLPPVGAALDVAGGTGRHARWLRARGWTVTLVDISEVALARAGEGLVLVERDLEADGLPEGRWDLILAFDFLWRPLFEHYAEALCPGGMLVVEHPTRSNLERNERPSTRFLLEDGELPTLVTGLTVVRQEEGWFDGRHLARLAATR